jgi:hypothetical protein
MTRPWIAHFFVEERRRREPEWMDRVAFGQMQDVPGVLRSLVRFHVSRDPFVNNVALVRQLRISIQQSFPPAPPRPTLLHKGKQYR